MNTEQLLAGLTEHANAFRNHTVEESEWAATANRLRKIEVLLGEKRREIESEATHVAQAQRTANPQSAKVKYESDQGDLVEQIKYAYSFNRSRIFADMMQRTGTPLGALRQLVDGGALGLDWKITGLQRVAQTFDFPLQVVGHEIEDGDEAHVGKTATSKVVRA